MTNRQLQRLLCSVVLSLSVAVTGSLQASEVARADLNILGVGLEVDRAPVTTGVDVPSYVQTILGGRQNDEALAAPGMQVLGELTGPGIAEPITLFATPGRRFSIPALHVQGEYQLSNIRLVEESGAFLQQASPSFAVIHVTDVFKTQLRVRQLTATELRERGITIDSRNYEVYEYVVVFGVEGSAVEIPYAVIVDLRTHAVVPAPTESKYRLPPLAEARPPRFQPPSIREFGLEDGGIDSPPSSDGGGGVRSAPRIPAALIMPSGFGVLHQFFAIVLQVSNSSPDDANIRLDEISATIGAAGQMRVAGVKPAVTIGQPVPIYDSITGNTYLVAGAQGSAEWTLEALKSGTHPIEVSVEATYQKAGQEPFRLRGTASTAIVVSDPRFQINFSHPDTVRAAESYAAYAFVTNLSSQIQHVALDLSDIPACTTGGFVEHTCRVSGSPASVELDLQPGEMAPVPYQLTSNITGHVFAGAGSANDEALGVSVKLHMGVSESGIPLSPATLVMPHYARYLSASFVNANMLLLGLGYSLATAPLNQYTAKFPRVIANDVFQRAQEITRAGQRIFAVRADAEVDDPLEDRDAIAHLSLDLLGNIERVDQIAIAPELFEWDELRRKESAGRKSGAAMARELERVSLPAGRPPQQFVDDFAAATSHRSPFLFAYVHGAAVSGATRPYAMSVWGAATEEHMDVPAEADGRWVRSLPYGELTQLNADGPGEMALVGRWSQNVRIVIVPQTTAFTLHLIYPDLANGSQLRSDVQILDATPGSPVAFEVVRGARSIVVRGSNASPAVREVPQTALRVLGAAQDLHLNEASRLVSILFNRPLRVEDPTMLRDRISLTVSVPKANYSITHQNSPSDPAAPLQIPSAALQADARLVNVTFDKALSINADYRIAVEKLADLMSGGAFTRGDIAPRIDNKAPGCILTGRVLLADNSPVAGAEVVLEMRNLPSQVEVSDVQGRYLYEFVPRDIDKGQYGEYKIVATANQRSTTAEGAVRLVGEVHALNLVFLGRGTAKGQVRYSNGEVVANTVVTVGSILFNQFRRGVTDLDGRFEIGDLPVGPLTFSVVDPSGRPTFAANSVRMAGEVIEQDLVIERRPSSGAGIVRVTVRRSDTLAVVPAAHVGVYTQGYGLNDAYAGIDGRVEFSNVPAGLVSIIASDFGISRESPGIEVELKGDQTLDQTIIIPIAAVGQSGLATVTGRVTRDDPAAPGDQTKDVAVAGAILSVGNLSPVTAGPDGTYSYPDLPLSASGRTMWVFDPSTGRKGQFALPSLNAGSNAFPVRLSSANSQGVATIRVRLTSATGNPVNGYRVFEPGFPPVPFTAKTDGVYELTDVHVPLTMQIVAVPSAANSAYGDQMGEGSARVDFNGQVAIADIRLPGQGTVVTRLELRQPDSACSVAPCYTQAFGKVGLTYVVWSEIDQSTRPKTIVTDADPSTLLNTFLKVPAQQSMSVFTDRHPAGFAETTARLAFEGDLRNVTLRMQTLGDVTGRVYAHDGQTPIANAVVELLNDRVVYGRSSTAADGTFAFRAVAANTAFRVVAKYVQDGTYRTGYADGATPAGGGPVSNLRVVMREQSRIEGQVTDADGRAVPLATYWARELSWPNTEYGSSSVPLQADLNGRFILNNVFAGPFRITAKDPIVQERRGDYQGAIAFEGDTSQLKVNVSIGAAGLGTVAATVVDSLQAFKRIANAEVTLYNSRGAFDLGTTDDQGVLFFPSVPAGTYSLGAFSKTVGRAGRTGTFAVRADATSTQEIVLDFLGKVAGYVTDPETTPTPDLPSPGLAVQLASGSVVTRDSTDSQGRFTILGVPEGQFRVSAYEYGTGRMAFGPTNLFISKVVQEHNDLHLELEKTARLTVKAYLPNDAGGEGTLAPMASVLVEAQDYYREQQGNTLLYPRMITRYGYKITARELGGEERSVVTFGAWTAGETAKEHHVVFPSSGSVEVLVLDGSGQPVSEARVQVNGRVIYTSSNGLVTTTAVPFGFVGVQATKGSVGASSSGLLQSRSIPLRFTLNLGSSTSLRGSVEAEDGIGQPSVGTRVVITVSSRLTPAPVRLETLTDSTGTYEFSSIPVSATTVTLLFYGPDDTTIGAQRTVAIADGTTGLFSIERVKLDATPPRVLSVSPATNTTDVSPSSPVVITFSEPIMASFLTGSYFQIFATDDGARVDASIQPSLRPDGTFEVRLIPPAPPAGQRFPFKSNVLYRVVVSQAVLDTTGNALRAPFGSSFSTVNYTEPSVVRVTPAETEPLGANETIRVKFNKAIDAASIQPADGAVVRLERLNARGGTAVETIPVAVNVDPADPTTIFIAPTGVAIVESSFYRLTVAGVRDTQVPPNVQKDVKVVEFFSFDSRKPVARIVSPVSAGEKLVSQGAYVVSIEVLDEITNTPSTDIQFVDIFDGDGQWLTRDFAAPFTFDLQAPFTETATTISRRVSATDLSNNQGPQSDAFTWDVVANAAPANIAIVNTPSGAYPTQKVQSTISFSDEGVKVTVTLKLTAVALDGAAFDTVIGSQVVQRSSTAAPWPQASFTYSLPLAIRSGTATLVASVADLSKTGTAQATLEVLEDDIPPTVVSFLPRSETRFAYDAPVTIELKVRDAQTGVKTVTSEIPGINPSLITEAHTFDAATGVHTYRWSFKAPPKNADTRVTIKAVATDNRGLATVASSDVIWERVDDANIPAAEWITPLDGSALPANLANWETTLRVRATDDVKVTGVRFESAALPSPVTVTLPKSGTADIFETKARLTFPPDHAAVLIKAIVSDGDPAHDVELPIEIDPVAADAVITQSTSVSSITLNDYSGKTIVVRGANVRLMVNVPLSVPNLMVLDGAVVSAFEETKLDLTIADRLFVDADSTIDLTEKGYLGGLRVREDGGFTNTSRTGRTASGTTGGGTTTAGATNADASHGGMGGFYLGTPNATYGSITDPVEFGAGSGAAPTLSRAGANGGGALTLRTTSLGRVVVAGSIRADGGSVATGGVWTGAAGGSIRLQARSLITGPATRITANGGDQAADASDELGGGGGRIAVRVGERFDAANIARLLQAHGGRNGAEAGLGGGAGTVFLARPGASNGELIVSAFDERYPSSTQRVLGTPLSGNLTFDSITIGPRALARFDTPYTLPSPEALRADATALLLAPTDVPQVTITATTPAAGADVTQTATIGVTTNANAKAGVRELRTSITAQPDDVSTVPAGWPASVTGATSTIGIPATAPAAAATLRVVVSDRAGRTAESASLSFNVIDNRAPSITKFDVTPSDRIYANNSIAVDAAGSDDLRVMDLALSASMGSVTSTPAVITPGAALTRQFSVVVPKTATADTPVVLTLTASDGFPDRAPTIQQKTVLVKRDETPPVVTITKPKSGESLAEGTNAKFDLEAIAFDREVAVHSVTATFEGTTYTLAPIAGKTDTYGVSNIPVPPVDGTEPVAKAITVTVQDYAPNTTAATQPVFINPLLDPNAPTLAWVCTSAGALYPAGITVPLRVYAAGNTTTNGVSKVEFSINGGASAVAAETSSGSKQYNYDFAIPSDAAAGAIYSIRVAATSVSGNEATLLGTIEIVSGSEFPTASVITASDSAYDNRTLIVRPNGALTIGGAHQFKSIVILPGGKLVQLPNASGSADLLSVERVYVACGGMIDMDGKGYPRNVTYPGIAAPLDSSGGGHIGGGSVWTPPGGGSFGSVERPVEPGGGGESWDPLYESFGGGVGRIAAGSSVIIDGLVRANGAEVATWGPGAGGSIWITTPGMISGGGSIEVRGGSDAINRGGGGGGAIALEYGTMSGRLAGNLLTRGTITSVGRPGAAGSAYLKSAQKPFGDLIVDNRGYVSSAVTTLPPFGGWTIGSVSGAIATLAERTVIPQFHVGNWVNVTAPDGTVRGTWRIVAIANDPQAATPSYSFALASNGLTYDGYLMYAPAGVGATGRKFGAVRYQNGLWQYDNDNGSFTDFTPTQNDRLFASFRKNLSGIYDVQQLVCGASCGSINGLAVAELVNGWVYGNSYGTVYTGADIRYILTAMHEFAFGPDAEGRSLTLVQTAPAVTLEPGAVMQAGDTLRGVYRFNSVSVKGAARLVSPDAVQTATAPVVEAGASLMFNAAAPVLDRTKLTFVQGRTGPVLIGGAGAVADADGVDVVARNSTRSTGTVFTSPSFMTVRNAYGATQLHRLPNGNQWGSLATPPVGEAAAVTFRVGTPGILGSVNLGNNYFHLPNGGRWEVWPNGAWANSGYKQGPLSASTRFRFEKTADSVLWYVDDVLIHTAAVNVAPTEPFYFTFSNDGAWFDSVDFYSRARGVAGILAGADGSFSLPVTGTSGDVLAISARDRHTYPQTTGELVLSPIPATIGIATVAIPAEVTGGGSFTGTVSMRSAAGATGVLVSLASNNAVATLPSSVTIPPGQTSGTFTVTTQTVSGPVDVTIIGSWGGVGTPASVRVVKDATAPSLNTVTAGSDGSGRISDQTGERVAADDSSLISLVLSRSDVEGGKVLNGTVLLSAPAPAGGVLVALSSTAPQVVVPETVLVPEGTAQASFTVNTTQVGVDMDVQVIATWRASHRARLLVTACAAMANVVAPSFSTLTATWMDDGPPVGASATGDATFDATRPAFGFRSLHFAPSPTQTIRTYAFTGASVLSPSASDQLSFWVLVNPCNPPRQIVVTWSEGPDADRASWGQGRIITSAGQVDMGALPAGGVWTRLNVVGHTPRFSSSGAVTLTISVDGGEAWIDGVGLTSRLLAVDASAPPRSSPLADVTARTGRSSARHVARPSSSTNKFDFVTAARLKPTEGNAR